MPGYQRFMALIAVAMFVVAGIHTADAATTRALHTQNKQQVNLIDKQIRDAKKKAAEAKSNRDKLKPLVAKAKTERDKTQKAYDKVQGDKKAADHKVRDTGTKLQTILRDKHAAFEASEAMRKRVERRETWMAKQQEAEARVLTPLYKDPEFVQLRQQLKAAEENVQQLESQIIKDEKDVLAAHKKALKLEQEVNVRKHAALEKDAEYKLAEEQVQTITLDINQAREKFDNMIRNEAEIKQMQETLDKATDELRIIATEKLPPALREHNHADQAYRKAASEYDRYNQLAAKYEANVKRLEQNKRNNQRNNRRR